MNLEQVRAKAVVTAGGCWIKPKRTVGYASFRVDGVNVLAHRYAWSLVNGPVPDGLFVCHRCNNKPCFNPDHLYAATHEQNIRDAARDGLMWHLGRPTGVTKVNAEKETCIHGHPFDEQNTYLYPSGARE